MKDEYFADIEPIVGVLRVFQRGRVAGVDPYDFSATVVYHDDGRTVEFKGVTSNGTPFIKMRRAIFKALWIRGVNKIVWERRASHGIRKIEIDLARLFEKRKH